MIVTVQDFIDATAFERSVLATVSSIVADQSADVLDLRQSPPAIQSSLQERIGDNARLELVNELRPLLFGCAWKILDLTIELGLNQMNPQPKWRIQTKAVQAPKALVPALSGDSHIWNRIASLYARSMEVRHCLVHRQFAISAAGDMTQLVDRQGNPIPDFPAEHQAAFCNVVRRASVVIESSRYRDRDRLDLIASLDALAVHHGLGPIGGGVPARRPELIRANALPRSAGWTVDIASAIAGARRVFPGRPYYDIEISFPGTCLPPITGRLEDAPEQSDVAIDPANPPAWVES